MIWHVGLSSLAPRCHRGFYKTKPPSYLLARTYILTWTESRRSCVIASGGRNGNNRRPAAPHRARR